MAAGTKGRTRAATDWFRRLRGTRRADAYRRFKRTPIVVVLRVLNTRDRHNTYTVCHTSRIMIGLADAHEPKECLGDAQRVGCVLDRRGGEFDDRALNSRTYV